MYTIRNSDKSDVYAHDSYNNDRGIVQLHSYATRAELHVRMQRTSTAVMQQSVRRVFFEVSTQSQRETESRSNIQDTLEQNVRHCFEWLIKSVWLSSLENTYVHLYTYKRPRAPLGIRFNRIANKHRQL